MDRLDRIYRLHSIFKNHRTPIALKQIMEQLECSKSTADRDIQHLRDYLNAPIEYIHVENGYIYNRKNSTTPYELPGLWFSSEELHGLLICQQILQNISPGILSHQIASLQLRINKMLNQETNHHPIIADKIQIETVGRRLKDDSQFKRIATALFSNRQLQINYQAREQKNSNSTRTISPLKLIFHRQNWYITAYCHNRKALRLFAVDCVHSAKVLDTSVQIIPKNQLDDFISSSYGIFTGIAKHRAILEFSANRSKWVADEHWHPDQQGKWLNNGAYQLIIPFNDSRELIMDILKYGPEVCVIEPIFLKQKIIQEIQKMQKNYACPSI